MLRRLLLVVGRWLSVADCCLLLVVWSVLFVAPYVMLDMLLFACVLACLLRVACCSLYSVRCLLT